MSGWQFGGWPPPPPSSGGAVTFTAVRDALGAATTNVPFNFQPINQVASVNGVSLESSTDQASFRVGNSAMALPDAKNRIAMGSGAAAVSAAAADSFVAIGNLALGAQTTATGNVAIGHNTLAQVTTGIRNTAVGDGAGAGNVVGQANVFVGRSAGLASTGDNQIVIGEQAAAGDPTANGEISIGNVIWSGLTGGGLRRYRFGGSGPIAAQAETLQIINAGADTVPVLALTTTGANAAKTFLYVGDRDPSAAVSAPSGSYYLRVEADATSALYLNRSVGTGTSWSLVTAVP